MKRFVSSIVCSALMLGCFAGCTIVKDEEDVVETSLSEEETSSSGESVGETSGAASAEETAATTVSGSLTVSSIDTGDLSAEGDGYEGTKGTGDFNYGEALQKSILFYELQRSGDLPESTRCNWRGDSCLNDGSDAGLDLTGGWYDAGDNAKFNLPMAYSAAVLGWSVYECMDEYEESGQLEYILSDIKWVTDYLIKCHPEDEVYYYQVGDGNVDHSWWGPAEVVDLATNRPSYCVTKDNPGSAVVGEAAAALAVAAILFGKTDKDYSKLCLEHAESLFKFANETRSDAGYTAANGFYDSWSGFYDELAWAGAWLYLATDDEQYLKVAEECYPQASQDYDWALCWDDVHIGAAVLLAKITGDSKYSDAVEEHLDWWCDGITYTPKGLAWLDSWGALRYATTTSFVACVYADWDGCDSAKSSGYWDFAESQCNYALGSTGFSYMIGFGDSYPEHPHHRTSQGSYSNNMNEPSTARHTLYGALVGGPDANDSYTDEVSNYNTNEVACDYNAGFTGLLAKMYGKYHGQTLKNFGAVETPYDEWGIEASVNVDGEDFVEIKAIVENKTAWPARAAYDVELRYFVDLTEVIEGGGSASSIEVTTNYMKSGTVEGLKVWDEDNNIYYLSVVFNDGSLYPGGQEHYKSEIQVRMRNAGGAWDNSNDPSYIDLAGSGVCLFENGELVYGNLPSEGGSSAGETVSGGASETTAAGQDETAATTTTTVAASGGAASGSGVSLSVKYDSTSGNSISGSMEITNTGSAAIDFSGMKIKYYVASPGGKTYTFDCYYAGMNTSSGAYSGVEGITGAFETEGSETVCVISLPSSGTFEKGSVLTVNFSIHYTDWSDMAGGSYSLSSPDNIVVTSGGDVICGTEP